MLIHGCKSWLKIPCRFRGPHYTGQCTGYYVIHLPALIPGSLPFASQVTMSLRGETRRQNKESLGSRLFSHLLIAPPPPIPLLPSPGLPKKLTPIVKNSQGTPTLSKQPPVADLEGGLGAQLPLLWVKKRRKS